MGLTCFRNDGRRAALNAGMAMPLEEFNYIAEIIASIAVIASLLYVGVRIKQNTTATQATAVQSFAEAYNGFVGLINTSHSLVDNAGAAEPAKPMHPGTVAG